MTDLTPEGMASRLLAEGFKRSGPDAAVLSDPVADTPMVVTLDELHPYELNPRVTRNPLYDDIKASIRERGLDAPPAITRRPGDAHYVIRNGGNTRLAILRELWTETKDERFFRIACLFRPWSARGEIVALTGHLAENELHGGLSFIERALGVEKARELYEQEDGRTLTQTELARRLTADGYPITQPHISRMQDAVRYLLPAIPTVLYGGLGRPPIERLAALRRAGMRVWEARAAGSSDADDFASLFQDVLSMFDGATEQFSILRIEDELIGQMAERLKSDYDTVLLEMQDTERRQRVLTGESLPGSPASTDTSRASAAAPAPGRATDPAPARIPKPSVAQPEAATGGTLGHDTPSPTDADAQRVRGHIVSPAATTERLQSIQQRVADELGDALPDFATNALQAIPVQAGGLYPISDVWYIDPALDVPEHLRTHIAQFAREIADESCEADGIHAIEEGIGFVCLRDASQMRTRSMSPQGRVVLTLLHALHHDDLSNSTGAAIEDNALASTLGSLVIGRPSADNDSIRRLSDTALVKLFRLVRLARRLRDLESGIRANGDEQPSQSAE